MGPLRFTKMEGLGNDFVVIDATRSPFTLSQDDIRHLADRRFGVGCDQVLVVEPPRGMDDLRAEHSGVRAWNGPAHERADFRYRIFNADGGEVEQCGNGARCFVVFVRDHGLTTKREIRVETAGGLIVPRLEDDGEVSVDMGVPRFAPPQIPFTDGLAAIAESLDVDGVTVQISALSMGNPHAVQVVANVDTAPVATQGPSIERHPRFPQRVNAGFMEIVDRATIRLRVYERGAGETLACGTGACAAVVAGRRRGLLDQRVRVITRGGVLSIAWPGGDAPVTMKGPARTVFEGEWRADSAEPNA
ncbi:MAG TPA: diaminopimelate epimerase [Casimicrobiaceae bacterium]|nr:diaminopimelate epimerase [Casimicrobiaceae bacterium]